MQKDIRNLPYQGLTEQEVAARVENKQTNKPPRNVGKSTLQILAGNLFTLFNLLNILLAAALVAVGSYRNLLFLGVVVSNTVIGTVQELRAKRTIEKLTLLSAPAVQVVRGGEIQSIPMEEVVLDDLFLVSAGDQVCADGLVIAGQGAMDEALLTGESEPVGKQTGEELLSGSFVTEGQMYARAIRVGADSYAAQLTAKAKEIKQPTSELMKSMRYIIRTVGAAIVPLGLIQFFKQYALLDRAIDEAVVSTVAAMLGMIPEGLMLLTSVALAVGVIRLGKQRTLVQDLYGIESLARVDILCVDKTGTITKGMMEVTGLEPLDGATQEETQADIRCMLAALSDNNATFRALTERFGCENALEATQTIPFSSARKWSAASFAGRGTLAIGAAEFVLGGRISSELRTRIDAYAGEGARVLLLCQSGQEIAGGELPKDLAPRAIVTLSDVLREDAADTIAFFTQQDVTLKVISGDDPLTVKSVAQRAGLPGAEHAIDATLLDTPEKLREAASRYTVFGRVTPDQKKDLVLALKAEGHTVGMMGDGVNDIPALKASDCAIAMPGGSDAARRVAQMVLLDANFAAMPQIVMEGRRVINNITRAASLFLVKTTFSFLLAVLLVFFPMAYPFAPIQMTLISSLTVGIPSFFLAMEPNAGRVRGNFLFNVLRNALPGGIVIVLQIMIMMALSGVLGISPEQQSTIAVWTTGFSSLITLLLTCLPLTFTRGMLVMLMATGFFGAVITLGSVFYLVPLAVPQMVLTIALMALAVPAMVLMRRLIRRIMK